MNRELTPGEALDLVAFTALLRSKETRRFLWRMLSHCGVFHLSYRPGDPHGTEFREGRRSIGLELIAQMVECDAEAYQQMIAENIANP